MGKKLFILALLVALGVTLGFVAVRYKDYVMPYINSRMNTAKAMPEAPQRPSHSGQVDFAALLRKVGPSVVSVSAMVAEPDSAGAKGRPYEELGSGVVVSAQGHVATSAHLVTGAETLTVTLGDRGAFGAQVVGLDSLTDLAALKLDSPPLELSPLAWADSDRALTGDFVLAIGNPFGLEHSVTLGIISARGRAKVGGVDEEFIQTDAAINPGNSGGPLIDSAGAVLGIVTGAYPQSGAYPGIGFAVPSNTARPVIEALIREGRVGAAGSARSPRT